MTQPVKPRIYETISGKTCFFMASMHGKRFNDTGRPPRPRSDAGRMIVVFVVNALVGVIGFRRSTLRRASFPTVIWEQPSPKNQYKRNSPHDRNRIAQSTTRRQMGSLIKTENENGHTGISGVTVTGRWLPPPATELSPRRGLGLRSPEGTTALCSQRPPRSSSTRSAVSCSCP